MAQSSATLVTAAFDPSAYERQRRTIKKHSTEDAEPRSGRIYVTGATDHAAGDNEHGQLGVPGASTTGDENSATNNGTDAIDVSDGKSSPPPRTLTVPTLVPHLASVRVTQVSCGRSHTAFACSEGELFSMGLNLYGQLGIGSLVSSSTPVRVKTLGGIAASVQCGDLHTLVLRSDGRALSCGFNDAGRLGRALPDAEATCAESFEPLPLHAASGGQSDAAIAVVAVAAGGAHSAIVCADGSVYTCGRGECGQLGHGTSTSELAPRRISALKPHKIRRVALGTQHSLFLSHLGVPFACGCGGFGRLGLGTREAVFVPTLVASLQAHVVVQISAGAAHSSFVTEGGKVFLCGDDGGGQLGCETGKASVLLPTPPPKFDREEGLATPFEGGLPPKPNARPGAFLKKGEGKNIAQTMEKEAEERTEVLALEREREAFERAEAERLAQAPQPVRVLGASCGGAHTMFLLRAVVDPRVDYREDQVALAATVITSFFRGNTVRALDKAVERRKRAKEMKTHTLAQRQQAAEVIQAGTRMHLGIRERERREQLAQMRELRDTADEEGNNWARAQRQFQAAQTGNAFAGLTRPINLTKASW